MDALQAGGLGRDHRAVGGRVDGHDPAHAAASRAWLPRVPGADAPGQALRARADAGRMPAGAADWQHLVPQRQRHLEERPRQGSAAAGERIAGKDRADSARQPARRGLLPAELDGGLSMLLTQTLDKLDALGLFGMVLGLREQLESNQYLNLSFDERLGLLVDREAETRDSRRLALRLKAAKLRQQATVEDLDFRAPRGLDRSVVLSLAQAGWVTAHHNLLITGPTGAGKSFVACALTDAAVRRGQTALYVRTPRLLAELALSRGDGRYVRRLGQLARFGLLVLDDFLLTPPSMVEAKDLLEVIDDRSQVRSTLVVSQLPVEAWHPALAGGDPTLADAILDRLVQHAHRLPLTGASMRRRQPPPEADNPVA